MSLWEFSARMEGFRKFNSSGEDEDEAPSLDEFEAAVAKYGD